VHQRYRRQTTDGLLMTYIANMNLSSRSLKTEEARSSSAALKHCIDDIGWNWTKTRLTRLIWTYTEMNLQRLPTAEP